MKKILSLAVLLAAAAFSGHAQAALTHSVKLTWVDGNNPAGVTYSVWRATGLCSGAPSFSKLATGLTALTYTDLAVTPGHYCYQVTATVAGVDSASSNAVNPIVPSFPVVLAPPVVQ